MVADNKLKTDLMKRLGIQQAKLYRQAAKIRSVLDMDVDESIYLFALSEGMKLRRYIGKDKVERIRDLQLRYNSIAGRPSQAQPAPVARKKEGAKAKVYKIPHNDPLLTDQIRRDAEAMANVYPLFYYLENSVRSFVCAAMEKYCGKNWWVEQVNKTLRDKVDGLKDDENKNMWHQKRGDREVDYIDFKELKKVYAKIRDRLVQDKVFSKEGWLDHLIDEVYASRCVIAHMNPLDSDNIQAVKVRVRQWNKLMIAKASVLST